MRKEAQEQDVREKMEQEERELRAQREAEWVRKMGSGSVEAPMVEAPMVPHSLSCNL